MSGDIASNHQAIPVSADVDITLARQAAKAMAEALGFDATGKEEVAIAVSELASNLLKHAGQGRLILVPLRCGERVGIEIESVDNGPGIENVNRAISDGYSSVGSLGYGLGAVNRLMDEFEIRSSQQGGRGTHIVCKRWRPAENRPGVACPLDFGAATRPHPANERNGDAFVLERWGEIALVGVIDGVGHGEFAFQAAQAARLYVENHVDRPLNAIFYGVGRACHGTQGVVMALARFDWTTEKMSIASVGNIEARLFGGPQKANIIVRRGVIGLNAPNPVVTEHCWLPNQVLVLHSDGLVSHWQWEDFPDLENASATSAAQELLHRLAREEDDATVVVVKGARRAETGRKVG